MPNFKEISQMDLDIFFGEFGDIRNVNGKNMEVVVDEDLSEGRPRQPSELFYNADGVNTELIRLFVRADEFGAKPNVEDTLRLDGKLYLVKGSAQQMGILEITLEVHQP